MAEKVTPLKRPVRLHYGRLGLVEHAWNTHAANVPEGTTLDDVLKPDYWAHYARDIRPMDVLWVYSEDATWEAQLRVMFVSTTEVKTSLLWEVTHEKGAEVFESDTHEVVWKGPVKKFAVVRKDNKEVIADGFLKSEAYNYMRKHLRNLD